MGNRLQQIRHAEELSHTEMYNSFALFVPGSWLAKPVRTVLELLPLFDGYSSFRALDLGCGVGRNSIPIAQHFQNIPCRVDCVDILPLAIEKLMENAQHYNIFDNIHGYTAAIEDYDIPANTYDLILAISALEHINDASSFLQKLHDIRNGLQPGGIACLIVNTSISEHDKTSGHLLAPQFEVLLSTEKFLQLIGQIFEGWTILKHTITHQNYDIPRESGIACLDTDVVTFVVRRPI